jgi:hypothetical protein
MRVREAAQHAAVRQGGMEGPTSKVMRGDMMKGPSVTHSSNMRL